MNSKSAIAVFHRTSQWVNFFRSIKIFMDGQLLARIRNGEDAEFEVSAGEHILQVRIDYVRSRKLKIALAAESEAHFQIGSPMVSSKPSKLKILSSILEAVILFGSIIASGYFDNMNIMYIAFTGLAILWLYRLIKGDKSMSILYYLTFGCRDYIYVKPINPDLDSRD